MNASSAVRRASAAAMLLGSGMLLGVFGTACGPSEPTVGTQTNWLKKCQADSECGDLQCVCGTCTLTCDDDATCSDLTDGSCVPAEDGAAVAACGGVRPAGAGMCLRECPAEGCGPGSSCVAGVCTPTLEPAAHVSVDQSERFQTLTGIGSAIAYINDEVAAHPRKAALFDALFRDSGFTVLRLRNRYEAGADNLASTEEIVNAATNRLGHAPTIFLNSASPPAALKANDSVWCEGNPDTCTLKKLPDGSFDYAALAEHWRASLEAYAAVGIEPDYVSIQNNPNYVPELGAAIEACKLLPTEGIESVTIDGEAVDVEYAGYIQALDAVLAAIDDLPFSPQIVAPETTSYRQVQSYTAELDFGAIDAIAHHMYVPDPTDIDIDVLQALGELALEQDRPLFQSETQGDARYTAILMHASLAVEGASVFVHNGSFGSANSLEPDSTVLIRLSEDDFALGDPYYVMQHYAAHIAPGWVRVSASSDADEVLSSAWLSPDDNTMAIILTNPAITEKVVQLDTGTTGNGASKVTRTVLHGIERAADLGPLPDDGIVILPGQSLVTVDVEL